MYSAFDLDTFLPIAREALGHGVSARADAHSICDEMHNQLAIAGLVGGGQEDVERLYFVAYLIAADERDMPEIIQVASMPHIATPSTTRGLTVAIISGSLPKWRDAVCRGCKTSVSQGTRHVYNLIYKDLEKRALCATLKVDRADDGTFLLLEHK